jgi:hypothetical protein
VLSAVDLFPIKCFHLKVENYKEILDEALTNKEKVKEACAQSRVTNSPNHFTDYSNTITNHAFEKQLKERLKIFSLENEFSIEVLEYWTAFYGEGSQHEPHVHTNGVFDSCNYSGILYLSDVGGTTFFPPHGMTNVQKTQIFGKNGDVFLFPSSLLHTFSQIEPKERVIISFNLSLKS